MSDYRVPQGTGFVQMQATTERPRKPGIPILFGGAGLLRTLDRLGFEVPQALTAGVEEGKPLARVTAACGFKIDVYDLDARLKEFDIPLEKKMQLKTVLRHEGLL